MSHYIGAEDQAQDYLRTTEILTPTPQLTTLHFVPILSFAFVAVSKQVADKFNPCNKLYNTISFFESLMRVILINDMILSLSYNTRQ